MCRVTLQCPMPPVKWYLSGQIPKVLKMAVDCTTAPRIPRIIQDLRANHFTVSKTDLFEQSHAENPYSSPHCTKSISVQQVSLLRRTVSCLLRWVRWRTKVLSAVSLPSPLCASYTFSEPPFKMLHRNAQYSGNKNSRVGILLTESCIPQTIRYRWSTHTRRHRPNNNEVLFLELSICWLASSLLKWPNCR